MKKQSKTKFAILGLLTVEPMSGYEIKKMIQNSIAYFWSESNGQLYSTLNQLMNEGLLRQEKTQPVGKRSCQRYAITGKGRRELQKWLQSCDDKSVHRDENLLKLFFGANISKEDCVRRLKNRRKKLTETLNEFRDIAQELEKEVCSPHYIFWLLTLNNGIRSTEAGITWCRDSIRLLEKDQQNNNENSL